MRKFLIAFVTMAGIVFVIRQLATLGNTVESLQRGDLRFLCMAILVQGVWLVNVAALYRAIYRALGIEESLLALMLTAAAANFVSVVTPSAGVGGMAVFVAEARRKGYSRGRATVTSALYVLFDYAGFLAVLALGLIVLIRRDKLQTAEIIATGILLVIALALALLLFLGMYSEQRLGEFLARMAVLANKVMGLFRRNRTHDDLAPERAFAFAQDVAEGMRELRTRPRDLAIPLLLALSSKALLVIILFLVFMAFGAPVSAGTVIAGFSIAFLFTIVSPTASGVGVVEGILTLTLASFYIPIGDAAVVAITYRGVTFWLPLIFGMLALRWLGGAEQIEPARS